jgi:hypothetical protein
MICNRTEGATEKVAADTRADTQTMQRDPDMPDEIDFSGGVRGKRGRALLMEMMRLKRALRQIRDMQHVDQDPLQAARAMQDCARRALSGTSH